MIHANCLIREIRPSDNEQIGEIVRSVLLEFGMPKVGSAYEDESLNALSDHYTGTKEIYFVVEKDNRIVGGAGIKKLDNYEGNVCELQKMYFRPEIRGFGLGSKLIQLCLEKARSFRYTACYLETMPFMKVARKLYRNIGFTDLQKPLGDTGHYACQRWMIKEL